MRNKGFHHVAFACRDIQATVKFYEDLMGFPLIHTELGGTPEAYMRHIFFDLGDGSSLAFFDLHGLGEPEEIRTDISTGMGLPVWVNHVAFAADQAPGPWQLVLPRANTRGRPSSREGPGWQRAE